MTSPRLGLIVENNSGLITLRLSPTKVMNGELRIGGWDLRTPFGPCLQQLLCVAY